MTPIPGALTIAVDFRCNNRCRFCSQAGLPPGDTPPDIAARLERGYASGARSVDFVGGEPTLHDELPEWIAAARRAGFDRVGLQTNGRRLAYRAFASALAAAGLTHVDVSLHGPDAAVHEFHTTVPGSFAQTISGLRRAREAGVNTAVTTVLTRSNVHRVAALADVVTALGVEHWRVILAQSVGRAAEDIRRTLPRWHTAARHLADAHRAAAAKSCRLVVGGLPPCLEPALPRWSDPGLPARFAPPCDGGCALRPTCPGLDPGYLALYGDGELQPVTGTTGGREAAEGPSSFVGGVGRPELS